MKKHKYILILISLFFFQTAYALENQYTSFGGRTISDSSTLGDYIAYYFNFFLVIAAGVAFWIIIFAGINYLISGNNFSKRLTAKKMIFNAVFGIFLSLGSIVILNTISPDNAVIPPLNSEDYSEGIKLVKGEKKTWVNDNLRKITNNYDSIEWISPIEDLPAIYLFQTPDYMGPSEEIVNGSSSLIPENSSIWFLWSKPGSYILYDGVDFKKGLDKELPLSSTKDKTSLSVDLFDNVTKSIKINQPKDDHSKEYGLILFSKERFEGVCAWTFNNISDLSVDVDPENPNTIIGQNELSSVKRIVANTSGAQVTIYNRADCQNLEHDEGSRKCIINTVKENINIAEKCKEQGDKADFTGEEVLSISFDTDNAGVLLKANNNTCQYFEKTGVNNCISLVKYGNIYDPEHDILPAYLTLFSLDK